MELDPRTSSQTGTKMAIAVRMNAICANTPEIRATYSNKIIPRTFGGSVAARQRPCVAAIVNRKDRRYTGSVTFVMYRDGPLLREYPNLTKISARGICTKGGHRHDRGDIQILGATTCKLCCHVNCHSDTCPRRPADAPAAAPAAGS